MSQNMDNLDAMAAQNYRDLEEVKVVEGTGFKTEHGGFKTKDEEVDQKSTKIKGQQKNVSHTYNADRVVGNGSFGVVFAATIAETGNIVAVKKVLQDKRYKNREIQIIRELYHPNIIGLRHAFFT